MKDIGERILDERLRRGLTQSQIAERTGLSISMISAIENGNRRLNEDTANAIARALDTAVGFLFSSDGNDPVAAAYQEGFEAGRRSVEQAVGDALTRAARG